MGVGGGVRGGCGGWGWGGVVGGGSGGRGEGGVQGENYREWV